MEDKTAEELLRLLMEEMQSQRKRAINSPPPTT